MKSEDAHTKPSQRGEEWQDDDEVVLAPDQPTTIDQDEVTNEVSKGDENVRSEKLLGLVGEIGHACSLLEKRDDRDNDRQHDDLTLNEEGTYESGIEMIEFKRKVRCTTTEKHAIGRYKRYIQVSSTTAPYEDPHRYKEQNTVCACTNAHDEQLELHGQIALKIPKIHEAARNSISSPRRKLIRYLQSKRHEHKDAPYNTASHPKPISAAMSLDNTIGKDDEAQKEKVERELT